MQSIVTFTKTCSMLIHTCNVHNYVFVTMFYVLTYFHLILMYLSYVYALHYILYDYRNCVKYKHI